MRNLQKILALVLALIMSFSLVATAGAFSDDGDISDAYKDAVTVLNGLEVFKGYDNGATFQPKGNITRAEVAAIIYRIATGDVKDTQASIYSTYGQFTDVLDGSWYAGYVNYCANAGYIKGRGNKIFDPQATVTGYEALAMILRAVGYDKNGEFTGSNWQIRTASIANERGISKNVTSAMLGQAATREVVAELLFRSIIIPKVNFNANTLSYTEKPLNADGKKDTLGYESLKLEEIEGVVTANEYADLEATEPLSANRTRLDVDGVDYTLEYKSDLDYLGESRIAYVQNLTGSKIVNNVLLLGDTGDNVVYDEGKKIDTKDAAAEKGIKLRDDTTLYFVNYDPIDEYQADWRIEYVYTWTTNTYAAVERVRNNKGTLRNLDTNTTVNTDVDLNDLINLDRTQAYKFEYRKTIAVGEFLTPTDISLINTIFSTADYEGDYILGEVYVGTTSIKKTDDISDDISYREFVDTYLTLTDNKKVVEKNGRGNRLKLIDNNNDGVVEYVLQTKYTVTTVSKTDSDGKFVLENKNVPLDANDVVNEIDNDTKFVKEDGSADLALNDVVLYAVIDGNARTEKAEMVNAKIDKVNRTNGEVTTTDGTTYEDSSICAHAEHYNDNPKEMAGSTNYNLYLDKYGYLAAFNEAEESFALLVDGWYNRVKGGDEYAVKTWQDGKLQTVDVSANGDLFIGGANSLNNDWDQIRTLDNATGSLNNANRTDVRNDVHTSVAMLSSDGVLTPVDMAYHTLKQSYIIDMKDNRLPDRDGERGQIYTTRANAIDRTAYNVAGVGADADVDVRALSSTVYYFVYNALSGNRTITQVVREYVGYQNLPNSDYANYIEDVYAVGTTQTSSVNNPYYTAEVVVVELNNDYYNTLGGEQVFIPRFPIAGTNVTLEEVKLVRENGAFEEVTIDLSRSDLRYYDIANGTETNANRNALAAGLYRMWRVSDSDTYYVRYMSAAEIDAADRYYVGMVDYNTGTGAHNYTVVDLYGRDVNDAHARATGQSASALNLDTTKYYTYKGDELTESDRNTVMIQTPTADIRRTDTCVDWRNETQTNGGYQRNEVLIAYDKADNGEERIAYAISFNEYDSWDSPNSHVHDAAQTVWDSCTPYHNFGGAPVDPDADKVAAAKLALNGLTFTAIVVPAAEADAEAYVKAAIAAEANDKQNSLVITAADVTIGDISALTDANPLVDVAVTIALKSGNAADSAVGKVDVSKAAPAAEYVLTLDAKLTADNSAVLVNGVAAADGDIIHEGDTIALYPAKALTITGVDGDNKVTGDVTVEIKDGFNWSTLFESWVGVGDNGDMTMFPYIPPVAAAGMRARAAGDDVLPVGKVDTTIDKWAVKMVRDVGATYTITVGEVVWESTIGDGEVVWKLKQGTPDQAKAALLNIDSAVVEKIAMAPTPSDTINVTIKDGKNNTLTGWSRYATITVDGKDYTTDMTVKAGQVVNVAAKEINGMDIKVSINGGMAGATATYTTVAGEDVTIVVDYKGSDFVVNLAKGDGAWGITNMPETAAPGAEEGTYTFDVTVSTGREPRVAVITAGGGTWSVVSYVPNTDKTQWTITLKTTTSLTADAIATVSTIKAPVVTVYADPDEKIKGELVTQVLEQKAEPDGNRGTVCTFIATMRNSTDIVPTGPMIDSTVTPLAPGEKITYEKHPSLPHTWICTISGVQRDVSFKLVKTELKKVFFVNGAKALVKLPTDSKDAPEKNYVFAAPNGDIELKNIQVQTGYTLSATAQKVTAAGTPPTLGAATLDSIVFTKAANDTYTLTSNLLTETSVHGYPNDSMDNVDAVRITVNASIGNLVELVPQSGINMTTAGTSIVGDVQKSPVNGVVTYQISMKKGWYPVISSNVKKPDGSSETVGVITTGNWSIDASSADPGAITAVPENDRLTWTIKIKTTKSGKLALDCDAMPGAAIVDIPTGVTVDEPRSFVALESWGANGVPSKYKAEFVVDVREDYQLLNADHTTVEGWPEAVKTISQNSDGSWTVKIVSKDKYVGGAQIKLQSEELYSVQLIVPDDIKDHVRISGKELGYAGSSASGHGSTITTTSFTVLVDEGWELTEANTWKQTDDNGFDNYNNATMSHNGPAGGGHRDEYTVTASDVRGNAIVTLAARESVSASAILRGTGANSGDISIMEQGSVEAINGVSTFHVYVTNGMGIIKAAGVDASIGLKMTVDKSAPRKDGMTAYVVEASGIRNRLVPVDVEIKDLIEHLTENGDSTKAAGSKDGYIIAGRPGGAIMEASVYGFEATIIGYAAGGADKGNYHYGEFSGSTVGVKSVYVLAGYTPVPTSAIEFTLDAGATSIAGYTAWSVNVTPNPGDVDNGVLNLDIARTFEVVSD